MEVQTASASNHPVKITAARHNDQAKRSLGEDMHAAATRFAAFYAGPVGARA
jgi:hypothetical protein